MNKSDLAHYKEIQGELSEFHNNIIPLNGILDINAQDAFIKQILDSMRRIEYVYKIGRRDISKNRCDPSSPYFDPIKAAIYKKRQGDIDEAFWLIFLSTNYGKHLSYGWRMTRDIYGGLGKAGIWTWDRTSSSLIDFKDWIDNKHQDIRGSFGNHRKYESLRPDVKNSPSNVVSSYVEWVGSSRSHQVLIQKFNDDCNSEERLIFSEMYKSLDGVLSFGRTARFDYLTMIAKLGLANIEPDSTYMKGSTGPIFGARLLFSGIKTSKIKNHELEENLMKLEENLSIGRVGMQVLEDALCNWQKNPNKYVQFKG